MIELIFVLIIVEIVFGVYLILFLDKKIRKTEAINDQIEKSKFTGNLTEFKLNLKLLNTKLQTILEEKIKQEKNDKSENIAGIINSVLIGFSLVKFLKKKNLKK